MDILICLCRKFQFHSCIRSVHTCISRVQCQYISSYFHLILQQPIWYVTLSKLKPYLHEYSNLYVLFVFGITIVKYFTPWKFTIYHNPTLLWYLLAGYSFVNLLLLSTDRNASATPKSDACQQNSADIGGLVTPITPSCKSNTGNKCL